MSKQATAGTSGQHALHRREGRERLRLVDRREVGQRPQALLDLVVEPDRAAVAASRHARSRWPTASIGPKERDGLGDRRVVGRRRAGAGRSADATTASSASRTRSFRLLEPALTTRIRDGPPAATRSDAAVSRPRPVADLRRVLALEPGVRPGLEPAVDHPLPQVRRPRRRDPAPGR